MHFSILGSLKTRYGANVRVWARRSLSLIAAASVTALVVSHIAPTSGRAAILDAVNPALMTDAREYAADQGITVSEAVTRLQLQDSIGDLDRKLTSGEGQTFAGLWIQHKPDFRVIVLFTQGGDSTITKYVAGTPLAPLIEVRTTARSLADLRDIQRTVSAQVGALDLAVESGIKVPENLVELYVSDQAAFDSALEQARIRLPDGVRVVTEKGASGPTTDIYAGLTLPDCTSGFSVSDYGGTRGISTAAHCSDVQYYAGVTLPFQWQSFSGDHDGQWNTAPGLYVTNRVYDGSTYPYYYRDVNSKTPWGSQPYNALVCHYGKSSHYGCGYIVDKYFTPSWVPNAIGTWIRVHRDGIDLSIPGDSGGPWFSGNSAYGIMSGQQNDYDAVYMAEDYLENLSLFILTAP